MNETFSWDPLLIHDGLNNASCGNGYTMGNVVISPSQAARFWVDVMGGKLLNESSIEKMTNDTNELYFDIGGHKLPPRDQLEAMNITAVGPGAIIDAHITYGMGLMGYPISDDPNDPSAPLKARNYTVVGHGGEDWGTAMSVNYIEQLGVSYVFGGNVHGNAYFLVGQNTSMTWNENNKFGDELTSGLVKAILKHKAPKNGAEDVKKTRSADQ